MVFKMNLFSYTLHTCFATKRNVSPAFPFIKLSTYLQVAWLQLCLTTLGTDICRTSICTSRCFTHIPPRVGPDRWITCCRLPWWLLVTSKMIMFNIRNLHTFLLMVDFQDQKPRKPTDLRLESSCDGKIFSTEFSSPIYG